ncbi:hypothetical protein Tco_0328833 [Tanacetum coccineum]
MIVMIVVVEWMSQDKRNALERLRLEVVSLVDVVLDGAFGGVREEEVVVGDGVERFSLSLVRSTNSVHLCMIVSFDFLEPKRRRGLLSMKDLR